MVFPVSQNHGESVHDEEHDEEEQNDYERSHDFDRCFQLRKEHGEEMEQL